MGIGEEIITEDGKAKVVGFEWGVPIVESVQETPPEAHEALPGLSMDDFTQQPALFGAEVLRRVS